MLGNEAIAQGLMESGCVMATSYPGTPASEILASFAALQKGRIERDMSSGRLTRRSLLKLPMQEV